MSLNLITLQDARSLKRYVDNGSCDQTRIDQRIDEALRRLWPKMDPQRKVHRMRIRTQMGCFTLPFFAETLLAYDIDGAPTPIMPRAYEFLSSGVGDLNYRVSGSRVMQSVVDAGEFPTMFDVPIVEDAVTKRVVDKYQLIAFSKSVVDFGKTITIRGLDKLLNDIGAGQNGVTLKINRWTDGIEGQVAGALTEQEHTSEYFRQVTQVYKPITDDYVTLYAFDPVTSAMHLLAKMHPRETTPHYRRYKIAGKEYCDANCILAMVRLRYISPVTADDILPVQNLDALKFMLMALKEEDAKNLQVSLTLESKATDLLREQHRDQQVSHGMPVILDVEYRTSMSRRINMGPV